MPMTHESHSVLNEEVGFITSNSLFYSKTKKTLGTTLSIYFQIKKKILIKIPRQYIEKIMFTPYS